MARVADRFKTPGMLVGRTLGNWSVLMIGGAVALQAVASGCTDEFSDCMETHTCPRMSTENAGMGGASSSAGSPEQGGGERASATAGLGGGNSGASAGSPPTTEGDHYRYVFDTLTAPAAPIGFDLNDDGSADNAFGEAILSLANYGLTIGIDSATAIENGSYIGLADVRASSLSTAMGATLQTFIGQDPSPAPCLSVDDCGHHLDGNGAFEIYDKISGNPCIGSIENGTFEGVGGTLPIGLGIGLSVVNLLLHEARAELVNINENGFEMGRLGGGLLEVDLLEKLFPAIQAAVQIRVAQDCLGGATDCGCETQSTGEVYLRFLDTDADCSVTLSEMKQNSLFMALFPLDIDIDDDGENDAISAAFSVSGVKARFVLP